jgi:hypothetical protein
MWWQERQFKVGDLVVASEDVTCCCGEEDCLKNSAPKGTTGKVVKTLYCNVHGWTVGVEFGQPKAKSIVVRPESITHPPN